MISPMKMEPGGNLPLRLPLKILCVVCFLAVLTQIVYSRSTSACTPEHLAVPEDAEPIVYGTSGEGRALTAYRFGDGENVMVLGFAIHGYEDQWAHDGDALVYTAERLMDCLSQNEPLLRRGGWTVYVLPCMNPDGLLDGYTANGPGRCTTRYEREDGTTSIGGIDLNRSFPHRWTPYRDSRYCNGSAPLAAAEAKALAQFITQAKGSGENVLIDAHGWMAQIIPSEGRGVLYQVFHQAFPENTYADLNEGTGYFAAYAADLGYHACLFEFPGGVHSLSQFEHSGWCELYNSCILSLLDAYGASRTETNEAWPLADQFNTHYIDSAAPGPMARGGVL